MSEKKRWVTHILEEDLINAFQGHITNAIGLLQIWENLYDGEGYDNIRIENRGMIKPYLNLIGDRLETDEEFKQSLRYKEEVALEKEREQYLKLKAKFYPED